MLKNGAEHVLEVIDYQLTGTRVSGIPSIAATNIQTTSPMFEDIIYLINCFVLLYIALPSATACTENIIQ